MDAACLQRLVSEVALRELGETERMRQQALTQMRDWILQHPNIRNCRTDDSFLLRFLRVKKYNIPKAQKMLLKLLNIRNVLPLSLVGNLDVAAPSVDELITNGFYFVSPHRDDNGRQVIMTIFGKLDPKQYSHEDAARAMQVSNYALMENDDSQVLGFTYVFDAANATAAHLGMWPSPFEFIRFLKSGEASVPMRNKEIHILNLPSFAVWIFNLLKAVMTKKIQQRIMVHSSLDALHKRVNPRVLPVEYGGLTPMKDMITLWKEELVDKRDIILSFDDMKLLSNKDIRGKRNSLACSPEESLRTLEID